MLNGTIPVAKGIVDLYLLRRIAVLLTTRAVPLVVSVEPLFFLKVPNAIHQRHSPALRLDRYREVHEGIEFSPLAGALQAVDGYRYRYRYRYRYADAVGRCATFSTYAFASALGLAFVYIALPETKGKAVSLIHAELHANPVFSCCAEKPPPAEC
jgi:hypothetical protein